MKFLAPCSIIYRLISNQFEYNNVEKANWEQKCYHFYHAKWGINVYYKWLKFVCEMFNHFVQIISLEVVKNDALIHLKIIS